PRPRSSRLAAAFLHLSFHSESAAQTALFVWLFVFLPATALRCARTHTLEHTMIAIQLPDGSKREFPGPVTVAEVAASIGAGLAKAALAGRVGQGEAARLVDTSYRIESDTQLAIVTDKDADGLDIIRHSTAHLLAYAVKELFPEAQVTIGPTIEDGF